MAFNHVYLLLLLTGSSGWSYTVHWDISSCVLTTAAWNPEKGRVGKFTVRTAVAGEMKSYTPAICFVGVRSFRAVDRD